MAPLRTHELPDRSSLSVVGSSRRGDQIKKPDSRSPPRARPPGCRECPPVAWPTAATLEIPSPSVSNPESRTPLLRPAPSSLPSVQVTYQPPRAAPPIPRAGSSLQPTPLEPRDYRACATPDLNG
ncbi:hypothetical protein PAHAL_1G104400 [Panicum hallii]|uniref:Uncharacterized protein n=1 Tax=Panicum hallii TaxID=206008 RepID=A0A2S3GNB8_9POAL|nr:hypothetical protein PAHAL_1G104400 [Panicum hallii]